MFLSIVDLLNKRNLFGIRNISYEFRACIELDCSSVLPNISVNLDNDKIKFNSILTNQAFNYTIFNHYNITKNIHIFLDFNIVTSKNIKIYEKNSTKNKMTESNNYRYYIDLSSTKSYSITKKK